jgi:anti-sigma regulatory factor (Ser/Thr protein kinase)
MARLLLVDPDDALLDSLRASPLLAGHTVDQAAGDADALRRLRHDAYDVVLTCPRTTIDEDLALLKEAREVRPGVRAILLAPRATPTEVVAALRSRVFACFTAPFDAGEIADMARRATEPGEWREGIEVLSAKPGWLSVRVNCRLLSAERLVRFLTELGSDVPEAERGGLLAAFREILLNAMEHGGGFDPDQVVEVSAARTERAIVFHVRDPGPGFDPADLPHAAISNPPADPVAHAERRAARGLRPGGFGLLLARSVVDELIYNEQGNEVLMIKHTK